MVRVIEKTVFKFDELSDSAKEKARDWYRQFIFNDSSDWECVYDDAATIAAILGIDIRQKPVKLMSGATRYDPAIYFSGFYNQGDYAAYDGRYSYKAGWRKALIANIGPESKAQGGNVELWRIANALHEAQRAAFYRLWADCGAGRSSQRVSIDYEGDDTRDVSSLCDDIEQALKDFAAWIYDQLRTEYEYQCSNEAVDESIGANEYEFSEDGAVA